MGSHTDHSLPPPPPLPFRFLFEHQQLKLKLIFSTMLHLSLHTFSSVFFFFSPKNHHTYHSCPILPTTFLPFLLALFQSSFHLFLLFSLSQASVGSRGEGKGTFIQAWIQYTRRKCWTVALTELFWVKQRFSGFLNSKIMDQAGHHLKYLTRNDVTTQREILVYFNLSLTCVILGNISLGNINTVMQQHNKNKSIRTRN